LVALLAGAGALAVSSLALAAETTQPASQAMTHSQAAQAKNMTVIHGKLAIKDQATRSFTVAKGTKTYTAPAGVDLASLAGKEVRVEVRPDGTVAKLATAPPMAKHMSGSSHKTTD